MNRILMDRLYRKNSMMDGRNPYGSKGGHVSSRHSDRYAYPEYDSRHSYPFDERFDSRRYDRNMEYPRQFDRGMEFMGYGEVKPMYNPYHDMHYDMNYDMGETHEEYKKDLKKWIEKLKRKDRFGVPMEQAIQEAKQMGVKFDDFDEHEFYAIYLMEMSDHPERANNYQRYLIDAKEWLMDDDVEMKGSEKVCAYLYYIVLGEK